MGDTPREQHEDKSPDGGSRDVPPSRPGGTAEGDVCNLSGTSCRQMVIDDSDEGRNVRSVYRRSDCAEMHVWTQYGPSVKRKMPTENDELASSQCDLLFDTTGKQVASVAYFHQIFYLILVVFWLFCTQLYVLNLIGSFFRVHQYVVVNNHPPEANMVQV
jgi:hypothetical protein